MNQISKDQAVEMIQNLKEGTIYSVTFIKKDGTERMINSVMGTSKGVNGNGKRYNDEEKGLISVLDLQLRVQGLEPEKCWRTVSKDTIQEVKVNKECFVVM